MDEEMTREQLLSENQRLRKALAEARRDAPASERRSPSAFFREAFHLGPAGMAVTRLSDGTFLDVNEQFASLSGYERGELLGHSSLALNLWRSGRLRRLAVGRLKTHGEIADVEFWMHTKAGPARRMQGSCRLLRVEGEECLLVSCVDITERRRAQVSEQESQELFRRIFQVSPVGIAISSASSGTFLDANPELCHLVGYELNELLDAKSADLGLWHQPDQREVLVERLKTEGAVHDFELVLLGKDGHQIDVLGAFQQLELDGEEAILSVLSDISARKQAEDALRQAKDEAEDLAQFRSSVIANMTHEVRTPLTVILGFTSMLREGVSERHRRFVDLIERSGRRLLLTLDSVLDLAQIESGTLDVNRRPYNLVDVVDSMANHSRPLAQEKELQLEIRLPDHPLYANVDYELLTRALKHLIDNAVKFTDEGRITLALHAENGYVHIDVRDTGIGIEEAFQEKLFSTFSQESSGLERDYQGSGMGLAVAGGLVERFEGEIWVESEKGTGSTFTIVLPAADLRDNGEGSPAPGP